MDWKRKILVIVGSVFLLWILTALLLPSTYMVSKSIDINGFPKAAYHLVNNLAHHTKWSAKTSMDSTFRISCLGATTGANASCDYTSNKYDNGILRINHDNGVDSVGYSEEKSNNTILLNYALKIDATPNNTCKVTLHAAGSSSFFGRVINWYKKRKVAGQLTAALNNLRKVAEERSLEGIYNRYQVKTRPENQKFFVTRPGQVEMSDVLAFYARTVPILYDLSLSSNITVAGDPAIIYQKSPLDSIASRIRVGLPTLAAMDVKDTEAVVFAPASVVTTMCSIADLNVAHQSIKEYMFDRSLEPKSPVIETYVTKPTNEGIDTPQKVIITYYFIEN